MVLWPPSLLACTIALRLALAAAVGMSRRRLQQSSSARDDEDGVAASPPGPLHLPELLGRMLKDAAAAEDEGAFRLDDGSVWKPLRETDQVRAAGEHVGDLPEVKNELGAIDRAASAIESELVHRQSTLDGQPPLIGAVNEGVGHVPMAVDPSDLPADAVQGTDASGHNKGLARPRSPTSLNPAAQGANYQEPERPSLVPSQARLEQKTGEADDRKDSGPSAIPANNAAKKSEADMLEPSGASESYSKSTQTVTSAADASAQTKAEEPESKLEAKPSVDRSVQTSRKASRDRQSQTTGPVLMSMETQTDIDAAPWYLFRTSVQKKKLAVAISVFFIFLYFVLCYNVFAWARDFYEGEFIEEFEPFEFLNGLAARVRGQNAPV